MKKIMMALMVLFLFTACATATPREINERAAMKRLADSGQTTGINSERPLNFLFGAAKVIFGAAAALTGNPLELINVLTGGLDVAGSVQSTASSTEGTRDTVTVPETTQDIKDTVTVEKTEEIIIVKETTQQDTIEAANDTVTVPETTQDIITGSVSQNN